MISILNQIYKMMNTANANTANANTAINATTNETSCFKHEGIPKPVLKRGTHVCEQPLTLYSMQCLNLLVEAANDDEDEDQEEEDQEEDQEEDPKDKMKKVKFLNALQSELKKTKNLNNVKLVKKTKICMDKTEDFKKEKQTTLITGGNKNDIIELPNEFFSKKNKSFKFNPVNKIVMDCWSKYEKQTKCNKRMNKAKKNDKKETKKTKNKL